MISESRLYKTSRETSNGSGRRTRTIQCPFCDCEIEAYVWSLAGSGKRCYCGAKHDFYGTTTKERDA